MYVPFWVFCFVVLFCVLFVCKCVLYCTVLLPPGVSPTAGNKYRVEQRKHVFFKWLVLGKGGVDDVGREPADSSDNAVSVAMAHWNVQHRVVCCRAVF